MIEFSFDLKPDPKVQKKVQKELVSHLNAFFDSKTRVIRKIAVRELEKSVRSQPEWYSLAQGYLRQHFGLPNSLRNIQHILGIWLASIEVKHKQMRAKSDGSYSGGITIRAVRASYMDVLKDPIATYVTENGFRLHWLEWLLLEGGNTIISTHSIVSGQGRAGRLIMIPTGGGWGVPEGYQGTKQDNMITRAIKDAEPNIIREIERMIK